MSRLPPVPPASRPVFGPDAEPKPFEDVTHRVRLQARRHEAAARQGEPGQGRPIEGAIAPPPADSLVPGVSRPMLNLAIAGFAGYVVGYLAARR